MIPGILLLLFLVVFPVFQTLFLSFLFHPTVRLTLGENSDSMVTGVVDDVGVTASQPAANFDAGIGSDAAFPVNASSFLWLRFDLSGVPAEATITEATLILYSLPPAGSIDPLGLTVVVARNTTAGEGWLASAATWETYDGVRPWTGGSDGGEDDRGVVARVTNVLAATPEGPIAFAFSRGAVARVQDGVGQSVSLQLSGTDGHERQFVLSEGADGRRPMLEVVYDRPEVVAGFQNYEEVLTSRDTVNPTGFESGQPPFGTMVHNLIWIAVHLPMSLLIGLFLALTLQKVRGASLIKSMIFIGMVTPMIVAGIILRFLFESPVGIVPTFFGAIGLTELSRSWLTGQPTTLLFGLIFGSVWLWTGFSLIVYSAGLTTIPTDYYEAARIDGASDWQIFRKITWPLLKPITIVVVTMTLLWELKLFDIVIGATNAEGGIRGAGDVLALQMFRYAFVAIPPQFAEAAVVATVLTLLTLVVAAGLFRRMLLGPGKGSMIKSIGKYVRKVIGR